MRLNAGFTIGSDHPSLPGHFPGDPVIPGVVLADEVCALVGAERPGWRLLAIPQVKFLSPVRPGEIVSVSVEGTAERLRFSCRVGERLVANGQLRYTEAAAE